MRPNLSLQKLKAFLKPGGVYRRQDLLAYSTNIDRALATLLQAGILHREQYGLYYCPIHSEFGPAKPREQDLIKAFLRDDRFVVYSPNLFNSLGLGTTQLYNTRIVFNRKRVGEYTLANRTYSFYRWREAPKELSKEFLVVEFLNKSSELSENTETAIAVLKTKMPQFDNRKLLFAARHYGKTSTYQKLLALLSDNE